MASQRRRVMYHEHVEVVTFNETGEEITYTRKYAHGHILKVGESKAHIHEWGWVGYGSVNVSDLGIGRPIPMSTGNVELKSDTRVLTTIERPE